MKTQEKDIKDIKSFFNSYSRTFSSIYSEDDKSRGIFDKLMDKLFRQAVYQRYAFTLEETAKDSINSVLDVGCGRVITPLHSLIREKPLLHLMLQMKWLSLQKKKYHY